MSDTFDPTLLDAIERLVVPDWEDVVWRQTVGDSPPLRANTRGARWNPQGVEALYCSLQRDGAVAELEHLLSRQPVVVSAPRVLNRLKVRLKRVADLADIASVETLGFTIADFHGDRLDVPQLIGGAANWLGIGGILVPSARANATNLVVFVNALGSEDALELVASL